MSLELAQLVEVLWIDSCVLRGWKPQSEVDDLEPLLCASAGYLIRYTKKELVIAQSQSDCGDRGDCIVIPRSCVKEVRYVKPMKKSGKGKKC